MSEQRSRQEIEDQGAKAKATISHALNSKGETGAVGIVAHQAQAAMNENRHLTTNLMEKVCSLNNLRQAYKQVKRNGGSAGVDGMTTSDMYEYFKAHIRELRTALMTGTYRPRAVKGVKIPKPGGGERQLGIPTVIDRVVQQAISQVLGTIYEPKFSESSYGFRPKRGCHDALKSASRYVAQGRVWVVDLDLEKFFDKVNHDRLMFELASRIADKRLLKLIRQYLETGMMQDGVSEKRQAGTPQGSPLSPLLSNIVLDELDKELERRGHKFCRYADDCNIYVGSEQAGQRVMASVTKFIEERLLLKVNTAKSAVAQVDQRKFLGYRLQKDGSLSVAPESLLRLKNKIREQTKRNRGRRFEEIITGLNQTLRGWINYFILSKSRDVMEKLDAWIRRKLRCYRLKQRKKGKSISNWLMELGIEAKEARNIGSSGRGWWRLAKTPALHRALSRKWFKKQELESLEEIWSKWVRA